jgi:hypothetical protein
MEGKENFSNDNNIIYGNPNKITLKSSLRNRIDETVVGYFVWLGIFGFIFLWEESRASSRLGQSNSSC